MTALLETRDLTRRFGGVVAIDKVNFAVDPLELRCLIGSNGAGKSTFFKMLTAQMPPTSGAIIFDLHDITDKDSSDISRMGIGIKNQVPDVLDGLTVEENIWLAARSHAGSGQAKQIVEEALSLLDIKRLRHDLVGNLAHGQRQWVEFGMVVALNPKLALLDEPTAGMTASETARTAELILELNKSMAVIVVEHDMQFIHQLNSRVTVFHQGRILAEGSMERIQQNEDVRNVYLGRDAA
ncbi:ATP-binding cassette domain-containing protein [Celeribacter halophilus]|jgi:branched-chain amino acid transport system ATP-binding protein/urea transport system ATP-binding protein|uniref:ATP-binding cassette domain-containing protein n=1 Tax=Celeribacter halophilus TaxID=576117 RepID=UPI003A917047